MNKYIDVWVYITLRCYVMKIKDQFHKIYPIVISKNINLFLIHKATCMLCSSINLFRQNWKFTNKYGLLWGYITPQLNAMPRKNTNLVIFNHILVVVLKMSTKMTIIFISIMSIPKFSYADTLLLSFKRSIDTCHGCKICIVYFKS